VSGARVIARTHWHAAEHAHRPRRLSRTLPSCDRECGERERLGVRRVCRVLLLLLLCCTASRALSHNSGRCEGKKDGEKKNYKRKAIFSFNFFFPSLPVAAAAARLACVCVYVRVLVENCRRRAFVRGAPIA